MIDRRLRFIIVATCVALAPLALMSKVDALPTGLGPAPLHELIEQDLTFHQPRIDIPLRFAPADSSVGALERAGILRPVGNVKNNCDVTAVNVVITENGQAVAATRGWAVWGGELVIPVGRFALVRILSQERSEDANYVVKFRYRFIPNGNAEFLKRLAAAKTWAVDGYSIDQFTLLPEVDTMIATVTFTRSQSGAWVIKESYGSPTSSC